MVNRRKVSAEEVENPDCMGLDHFGCSQPWMGKANVVHKEKDMNYHMEKASPSTRIADVLCGGVIYSSFLKNNQHRPEER